MTVYDRQAEAVRRKAVDLDMRQGWVLVDYFYGKLGTMEKEGSSLRDNIGQMVYGMDVDHERRRDEQIAFLPEGSGGDLAFRDPVQRTPRALTGLDLAEAKLMKGDVDGAGEIAETALKANPTNAEAHYVLGRIDLMEGDPGEALDHLTQTVQLSHDPRTIAWAHIYLGRMYDIARDPNNPDGSCRSGTRRSQSTGPRSPTVTASPTPSWPRKRASSSPSSACGAPSAAGKTPHEPARRRSTWYPTGKAEKDSYRPTPPQ